MSKFIYGIALTVVFFLPVSSLAMPCHCFTDRDYDPGQPAAADPYFLATTENSFFAVVNGMQKKDVVFAKQTPSTTAENLWVAYWLAEKTGEPTKTLMKSRFRNRSWATTLSALEINRDGLPVATRIQLEADPDDLTLASSVIDTILEERMVISGRELQQLRTAGADNKQTIIASLLALKTERVAIEYLNEVLAGQRSWGTHLLKSGLNGNDMEAEIKRLLQGQ
ncbi:hypothetical protein [Trichloromonas sp.]|uniref:hypothetical protein n=1 Tax=Trichloromonas sp. TaxID=3069249 RepID=UPI003D81748D